MALPKVSVFIPARDAATTIETTLDSIRAQSFEGEIEIVVAEGRSADATRDLVTAQPDVTVVDNPAGTTPAGLNAALAAATGEVLVRCDAHAVLPAGYVARAIEVLDATGADVVGGRQDAVASDPFTAAVADAHNSWIAGGAAFRTSSEPGPAETVYLGVFRRSTFDRFGTFDESMLRNQDFEFNHRVRAGGGLVYFHPDLSVAYSPRGSLPDLWRQYWRYGAGKRHMLARHPSSIRFRQLLPLGLVLGLLATGVLAVTWSAIPFRLLTTAYGIALLTSVRAGRLATSKVKMPAIAATMHLAWGFGFLFGRNR